MKHLIPYLPYKVKALVYGEVCEIEGIDLYRPNTVIVERVNYAFTDIQLLLRPLPELQDDRFEMEAVRKDAVNMLYEASLLPGGCLSCLTKNIMYCDITKLLEWHFDIFGLIKLGLAVDINKISDYEHLLYGNN